MASPAAARSPTSTLSKKKTPNITTPTPTTFCLPFVRTIPVCGSLIVGPADAPVVRLSSGFGYLCLAWECCREVCLHNWWLIKFEKDSKGRKALGVGGFASRGGQETRVFLSAAIAKRHDTVTVETTDGITITITGFINRSKTVENGFPSEVGNRFCFGFPHNWEEYAGQFCSDESSVDGTDSSLPICLDDLPVTRVRDLLMSGGADSGMLGKSIVNDIMQYFQINGTIDKEKRKDSYGTHPMMTDNSVHKHPGNHKKTKVDDMGKDDSSTPIDRGTSEFEKITGECETGINVDGLSRGVRTRSMTRLSYSRNTREQNLSPIANAMSRLTEDSSDQCGPTENSSGKRNRTIFHDAEVEADGTPHTLTVTRFSSLESLSEPFCKSGAASGEDANVKQIPDISAVRRSDRLRTIS